MRPIEWKNWQRTVQAVVDALFPPRCLACDNFFTPDNQVGQQQAAMPPLSACEAPPGDAVLLRRLWRPYVCSPCTEAMTTVTPPFCPVCGMVFQSKAADNHICGDCMDLPRHFQMARAALIYDQASLHIIHSLKYKGKIQLAAPLGELLLATFLRYWKIDDVDVVVPVPLHAGRFKERGFNQAFLLIRLWKDIARRRHMDGIDLALDRYALVRNRRTATQTGLSRKQRLVNIKNAFSVRQPDRVTSKHILLVDDVYTTGATVDECARVLIQNGALSVNVLTVARAI